MLRKVGDRVRGAALAFAGGFILAVAFMELIRRGVETSEPWSVSATLAGLAAGAGVRALITRWVNRPGHRLSGPRECPPPPAGIP